MAPVKAEAIELNILLACVYEGSCRSVYLGIRRESFVERGGSSETVMSFMSGWVGSG